MASLMLHWNEGRPRDLCPPQKQAPWQPGASPRQPQWGLRSGSREDNYPCPPQCKRTSSWILQPAKWWLSSTIQKVPMSRTLWRRQPWHRWWWWPCQQSPWSCLAPHTWRTHEGWWLRPPGGGPRWGCMYKPKVGGNDQLALDSKLMGI